MNSLNILISNQPCDRGARNSTVAAAMDRPDKYYLEFTDYPYITEECRCVYALESEIDQFEAAMANMLPVTVWKKHYILKEIHDESGKPVKVVAEVTLPSWFKRIFLVCTTEDWDDFCLLCENIEELCIKFVGSMKDAESVRFPPNLKTLSIYGTSPTIHFKNLPKSVQKVSIYSEKSGYLLDWQLY